MGMFPNMKRFSILSVRYRHLDDPHRLIGAHTNTNIRGSRSRSSNKLVRKAGDKRGRAHCPGIRDEQRCENVTTNSPCSPNVTFPVHSVTPPFLLLVSCLPLFCPLSLLTSCFYHRQFFSSLSSSATLSSLDIAFIFMSTKEQREQNIRVYVTVPIFTHSSCLLPYIPFFSPVHWFRYTCIHSFFTTYESRGHCGNRVIWVFPQQLALQLRGHLANTLISPVICVLHHFKS